MKKFNRLFMGVLCGAAVLTLTMTGCAGKDKGGATSSTVTETSKAETPKTDTQPAASSAEVTPATSEKAAEPASSAATSSATSEKTSAATSSAATSSADSSKTSAATANVTTKSGTVYTIQGVNMRKGPGKNYDVITEVPGGKELKLTGVSGGWSQVVYDGKEGFISNYYLSDKKDNKESIAENQTGKITAGMTMYAKSGVNMRSEASMNGAVLTTLPAGAKVEVIADAQGWVKVKYDGKEGYVGTTFLVTQKPGN